MRKELVVIKKLINEGSLQKAVDKMCDFAYSVSDEEYCAELYECLPPYGEMIKSIIKIFKYSICDYGDITKLEGLGSDVFYNYYDSDRNEIVIYNLSQDAVKNTFEEFCEIIDNNNTLKKAN